MTRGSDERGAGTVGAIVGFLALGATIYMGANAGPAYMANWQLQDQMQSAALAPPNEAGNATAKKRVIEAIAELGLSDYIYDADVVVVLRSGRRLITVSYEREVKFLPGFSRVIRFENEVDQIVL